MGSFRIIVQPLAEQQLREAPFPFRRQIIQAIYKLKQDPRPPGCDMVDPDFYRVLVHGWSMAYIVDDDAATVTIFRIGRSE